MEYFFNFFFERLFVCLLQDCGLSLKEVNSQALHTVFETFRSILHSGKLTSRVQYMIEVLFAVRKDNFKVRVGLGET